MYRIRASYFDFGQQSDESRLCPAYYCFVGCPAWARPSVVSGGTGQLNVIKSDFKGLTDRLKGGGGFSHRHMGICWLNEGLLPIEMLDQQSGDPFRFLLQGEVAGVFENLEAVRSRGAVAGYCGDSVLISHSDIGAVPDPSMLLCARLW